MKEKDFDTHMKGALDRLEEPYDPASWAALAQRLDAPFVEENPAPVDQVDKAVYHKLQQLEVPYQPAHWNLLAKRMVELRRLRTRLWVSKVAEAAIFLLLLANLRGFLGDTGSRIPTAPAKPRFNGPVAATQHPHRTRGTGIASTAANDQQIGLALTGNDPAAAFGSSPLAGIGVLDFHPGDFSSDLESIDPVPAIKNLVSAPFGLLGLLPSAVLPFDWLKTQPAALPAGTAVAMAKPHLNRFYFASYVGHDQNRVYVDGQTHPSQGFNTGFAIGYRPGKWGIEAGLSYSQKQYEPKKKVEIYAGNVTNGYIGSYLASVDADLITVPVKVTRHLAKVGRTNIHAVAGVTTNIAVQKAYRYKTVQFPGSAPSSQGPGTLAAQPQLRQTGRGVLENGGSLANNVYASADVGVRIEQPVAKRWTLFVEPTYRQSLSPNGLGPRPAKINTFSLQAGVMAAL